VNVTSRVALRCSAYPITVRLVDAAGSGRSSGGVTLHATGLTRAGGEASGPLDDTGNADPEGGFRDDAALDGYIFNLSTRGLSTGRYNVLFLVTGDPTVHATPFAVR
jgi:hypothetical protein